MSNVDPIAVPVFQPGGVAYFGVPAGDDVTSMLLDGAVAGRVPDGIAQFGVPVVSWDDVSPETPSDVPSMDEVLEEIASPAPKRGRPKKAAV